MNDENWEGGEEVESNWFKFNNVGDRIKGTLIEKRFAPSEDEQFSDQWIYVLKDKDGQIWNVGISTKKPGTIDRLNKCKIGEIIGIVFDSEGEPSKKGFRPSKNLRVLTWGMDPAYAIADIMDGKVVD